MSYIILFLLFTKHFIVDFIFQTDDMVKSKGIYGNIYGVIHSLEHAVYTACIFLLASIPLGFAVSIYTACFAFVIDFLTHYHIDYVKIKYGNRDISNKKFWVHLGLDQYAHYLTYLLLVALLTSCTVKVESEVENYNKNESCLSYTRVLEDGSEEFVVQCVKNKKGE